MTTPGIAPLEAAEAALVVRDLPLAAKLFDRAEQLGSDPERCDAGRWMLHMLLGDFEAAWRDSDRIHTRNPHAPDRFWRGEDFHGKRVMLRCLHGYGDALQFLRLARAVRRQASRLTVEVAPPLVELVRWLDGIDEVVTWGEAAPKKPVEWDVQIEINELMYALRLQPEDLPVAVGYLHPPQTLLNLQTPVPTDSGATKIGLVWTAGKWNPTRSVPFAAMHDLMSTPGCEFWNLQGSDARLEWTTARTSAPLHAAEDCAASVPALAALIAGLDLVITCDTLAAHLAGAQYVPCWLLLQTSADWRWMHAREDTPWYPSLRLFRRRADEGWHQLTARVAEELQNRRRISR